MCDCATCPHLDMSRKEKSETSYRYGCNARLSGDGYVCGWLQKDSDLKWQGCSDYTKEPIQKQLSLFSEV